jgi:hypothetical protein
MADRIIFTIKHDGETLAYLYQNWGRGDGEEIEKEVRKAAREYQLDLTDRADAITAIRLAGEALYGHALWNGCEDQCDDTEWLEATQEDRDYLELHRDDIIADNQDIKGITFFYGTSQAYPEYIAGWCEDAYTMSV